MRYGINNLDMIMLNNPLFGDTRLNVMRDNINKLYAGIYEENPYKHNDMVYTIRKIYGDYLDTMTRDTFINSTIEDWKSINADAMCIMGMHCVDAYYLASLKTPTGHLREETKFLDANAPTPVYNQVWTDVSGDSDAPTKRPFQFIHWTVFFNLINISLDVSESIKSYLFWDWLKKISKITDYGLNRDKYGNFSPQQLENYEYCDIIEAMLHKLYNHVESYKAVKKDPYVQHKCTCLQNIMDDIHTFFHSEYNRRIVLYTKLFTFSTKMVSDMKEHIETYKQNDPFMKRFSTFAEIKAIQKLELQKAY